MAHITYKIVEHDGGWAYKLGDVFSETFPNRGAAVNAAHQVANSSSGRRERRMRSNTRTRTEPGTRNSREAATARRRMWRSRARAQCALGPAATG